MVGSRLHSTSSHMNEFNGIRFFEHLYKSDSRENKAGYTATPVACGWVGDFFRSLYHLGRSSEAKDRKNPKKVKCDGQKVKCDGGV